MYHVALNCHRIFGMPLFHIIKEYIWGGFFCCFCENALIFSKHHNIIFFRRKGGHVKNCLGAEILEVSHYLVYSL